MTPRGGVTQNKRGSVMSGHSKWATIKHKKGATDAKRGRVFTRIIREISIAARIGGGEPNSNPRLRTAILAAKAANMPGENVERAILRGTGQLEGEQYEESTFEGYGPGGVGMLIQVVTTNRNRVVGEFRHLMSKNGGNLAEAGAVGWMFSRKGERSVGEGGHHSGLCGSRHGAAELHQVDGRPGHADGAAGRSARRARRRPACVRELRH